MESTETTETQPPATAGPAGWRRFLRFSLRGLLLLVLLVSVWLGWQVNRAHKQRRAVLRIQELGGEAWFDYQMQPDPNGTAGTVYPERRSPWPKWIRNLIGDEYFGDVVSVGLYKTSAEDADIELLADLPRINRLSLGYTRVTDRGMQRIAEILPQLVSLDLQNTSVTDGAMPFIGQLRQLESLGLWNTNVTDAGAAHLARLTRMRNLILDGTQITDVSLIHLRSMKGFDEWLGLCCAGITDQGLVHLAHLTKAKSINLLHSRVTKQGGASLSKRLPKCQVSY